MEWQPIETAPKDREIMLYVPAWGFGGDGMVLAKWEPNDWSTEGGYFETTVAYGYDDNSVDEPSHWAEKPNTP